ncbi:MAG: hypothetical protein KBA81_03025 [Rhabdochlamydiaceae bacterium]|nr:hypothetical protein [Rhabdochlamydiaceae bacterium]
MTGSVLRTARVLEKDQYEISGGLAQSELGHLTQVIIAAYGISNRFEIEGRWEDEYFSLTPRLQLLKSDHHWIDCLAFFQIGYGADVRLLGGPGIMFGKRFKDFSPYLAYKYIHFQNNRVFRDSFRNAHYVKLGARYYLPSHREKSSISHKAWFIGAEFGPTMFPHHGIIFEWAANIGFNF